MSHVFAIHGPEFSAKSTLALSIPGRKYVFDLEFGALRAAWRYPEATIEYWRPEPDISLMLYAKGERITGQVERWQAITSAYALVLQRDDVDVIVFDTAKELWTTAHKGWLQEKQDMQVADAQAKQPGIAPAVVALGIKWQITLGEFDYGTPNTRMESIINLAHAYNKTLVLINHERDIYGPALGTDGKMAMMPTGQKELDGFKHTLKLTDWILRTWRESTPIEGSNNKQVTFKAMIEKSPLGKDIVGKELINPEYQQLANLAEAYGFKESLA